ncbi:MAG TPA: reductive dehalogenase domain-containing protein [Bacillota bacterium]|nr:reductive dehalogenase domain-containing protein [Bacillota bacterium]
MLKNVETTEVVGKQERFDQRKLAFTRLGMGALGEDVKQRWMSESPDVFWRMLYAYTRKENSVSWHLRRGVDGPVKPDKVVMESPEKASAAVKEAARFFGAGIVGICELDQAYVYSHRGRNTDMEDGVFGQEIINDHKYAIVVGYEMSFDRIELANSYACDAETGRAYAELAKITVMLAEFIRELGYPARAHHFRQEEVLHVPLAVAAGLGELGRNGYAISPQYGPRFRTGVVTTDLPLAIDNPIDFAVQENCEYCGLCAIMCPVGAIPEGDKTVINGVKKWALNADACLTHWAANPETNLCCGLCIKYCPYNKRK